MSVYFVLITLLISWAYTIYCLFNGRKIKYEVNSIKKPYLLAIYGLMAILIVLKLKSFFGIGCAAFLFISGLLYSAIPSGFNEEAIYINGKKYLYQKMKDVLLDNTRLSFVYKKRLHYIEVEKFEKNTLEICYKMYQGRR